jgi:hypothetical protein
LSEALRPSRHLCSVASAAALSIAILLTGQPLQVRALPPYVVTSAQDFAKLPASGTDCKSTELPNNPCTLRAAIETANTAASGASINVPGNFMITLDSALGELGLTMPMSITSLGGGSTTVDGALQTRVFHIMSGTPGVIITGLTVRQGKASVGSSDHSAGGIWNEGSLTLNNVVVTLSQGKNAGGIGDNGSLTVNGGTISRNIAVRELGSGEPSVAGGLGVKAGGVAVVRGTRFVDNTAEAAGGIATLGSTSLFDVTVASNTASQAGGGIVAATDNPQSTPADLTITNSNISGNTTGGVGGGMLLASAHLVMSGSTISGNSASAGSGGGIYAVDSSATLTNDTLSGNVAGQGGGGIAQTTTLPFAGTRRAGPASLAAQAKLLPDQGGRILNTVAGASKEAVKAKAGPDDITLGWVTLAGNSAQTGGGIFNEAGLVVTASDTVVAGNIGANCSGPVTSGGYNLDTSNDCGFNAAGDRSNSDPRLGGLANNGGPTQTMALQTGSAALDAGDPGCPPPASDQRGIRRPQGVACDIGAFESTSPPVPAPPSTGGPEAHSSDRPSLAEFVATVGNSVGAGVKLVR